MTESRFKDYKPKPIYQKFDSWSDALTDYTDQYNQGTLVTKPIPGTIFWTKPQHPPSSSNHIPSLTESDQELWGLLEGLMMVGE